MNIEPFATGEAIVLRNVHEGSVRWAAPLRVAEDRGDFVALFLDIGTQYRAIGDASGQPTRDFVNASTMVDLTWGVHRALQLIRFGDWHATIPMWREDGAFAGWYINFQEPLRRTADGFTTMDLTLDMLIAPDRKRWSWKDEDEFAMGIAAGWYTEAFLAELKERGHAIAEAARTGAPPFDEGWEDWRPDPRWRPLSLPANWAEANDGLDR